MYVSDLERYYGICVLGEILNDLYLAILWKCEQYKYIAVSRLRLDRRKLFVLITKLMVANRNLSKPLNLQNTIFSSSETAERLESRSNDQSVNQEPINPGLYGLAINLQIPPQSTLSRQWTWRALVFKKHFLFCSEIY